MLNAICPFVSISRLSLVLFWVTVFCSLYNVNTCRCIFVFRRHCTLAHFFLNFSLMSSFWSTKPAATVTSYCFVACVLTLSCNDSHLFPPPPKKKVIPLAVCSSAMIQGGHFSGKPGKVRELKSGQGKVRENRKSQGKWIITIIQLPQVLFRQKYATMEFFTC